MQNNTFQSNQKILKKLRGKAELCRYSHSELKTKYTALRNIKECIILLSSVIIVALINLYYRKVLAGDYILILIWILPLLITILQTLDHTIFHWTCKISRHEVAVAIWGNWLRKADFLEKLLHQYETNVADEKMQNMQEKYNNCMDNTEQIPNNKFLKYKRKFKIYILKSKQIDEMSLMDIKKGNK